MKHRSLVNALSWSALALIGACHTTVETDTGTTSTETGTTDSTSTTTLDPASCKAKLDPPVAGCPEEAPTPASACDTLDLVCTFAAGACSQTFQCLPHEPFPDDPNDCTATPNAWFMTDQAACGGCIDGCGPCTPCEQGQFPAPCNLVGYRCPGPGGGNCADELVCTPDGVWENGPKAGCCI